MKSALGSALDAVLKAVAGGPLRVNDGALFAEGNVASLGRCLAPQRGGKVRKQGVAAASDTEWRCRKNASDAYEWAATPALPDPGADRITFWDDSTNDFGHLTPDSGDFTISGTTFALASAPTFSDFTNAQHDHTDADDGGTLTLAAIPSVTATAAELNILDGATLTVTELNYVDGVTSAIQTQIDGKVSKAGDTMTGSLALDASSGDSLLTLDANASQRGVLRYSAAGVTKFDIFLETDNTLVIQRGGAANPVVIQADDDIALSSLAGSGTAVVMVDNNGVLAESTAPTFTDFTNAPHDHSDADDGGQLTDAALSAAVGIAKGGTGQTTATAAFDALAPTTTQGDIIYHNGTDNVRLAAGTSGHFLKTNGAGANPAWAAASGGGALTLIDETTFTTASSVSFDNVFTSTYTGYRILGIVNVVTNDGQHHCRLRVGGADASGASYYWSRDASNDTGGAAAAGGSGATSWFFAYGTNSGDYTFFAHDIWNPEAAHKTLFVGGVTRMDASTGTMARDAVGGIYNATTQYDGFTYYPNAGTISGRIWVYGYQVS